MYLACDRSTDECRSSLVMPLKSRYALGRISARVTTRAVSDRLLSPGSAVHNYEKTQKSKAALAFCNECLGWAHAELIGDGRVGNKPLGSDFSYFDPTNLMEVMAAAQAFWNTENFWVHITYHQGTFQVTIQEPDADDPKFRNSRP